MTREERELSITYLEGIKEKYIEGEGYERHPLPEYYAIETAVKALAQEECPLKSVDGLIENIQSKMEKVAGRYGLDTPEWERPSLKIARNAAREECIKIIKEYCGMEE